MRYFFYTFFFEEEDYISLERLEKYLLSLMYMFSDEEGKLTVTQQKICDLANTSKTVLSLKKKYFEELGFMEQIDNDIYMKIPKDVKSLKTIDIDKELVVGKYKQLNNGSKLFYTYCLYLQKQSGEDYIEYSNEEIKKPFAGSINTIKKYCKELQEVDLLDRIRTSVSHSYHFKEII